MDGAPELVALDHDDYHAKHVGWTADGRQFFLTTPFDNGHDYLTLFLFDAAGKLLEAKIDDLGPRDAMDDETFEKCKQDRLAELGDVTFKRIEVAPFSLERFGTTFGFIAVPPEDEDDEWVVEVQPGNIMAFNEPWDSGDYDT